MSMTIINERPPFMDYQTYRQVRKNSQIRIKNRLRFGVAYDDNKHKQYQSPGKKTKPVVQTKKAGAVGAKSRMRSLFNKLGFRKHTGDK